MLLDVCICVKLLLLPLLLLCSSTDVGLRFSNELSVQFGISWERWESCKSVGYPFYVCFVPQMFCFRKFLIRFFFSFLFFSFLSVVLFSVLYGTLAYNSQLRYVCGMYIEFSELLFSLNCFHNFSQLFTTLSKLYCFVCSTYLHALFIHVTEHFRFGSVRFFFSFSFLLSTLLSIRFFPIIFFQPTNLTSSEWTNSSYSLPFVFHLAFARINSHETMYKIRIIILSFFFVTYLQVILHFVTKNYRNHL